MGRTLVIAECGSSWDCDIQKAFRLIDSAKACGADIAKFQWTSNAKAMAERRLGANAARSIEMYRKYLEYPFEILTRLKAHCDSVGIEFLVTVYLIEDIATIAPLVKRFKVSAFESQWTEFNDAHKPYGKPVIISCNPGKPPTWSGGMKANILHCISEYPTPVERLNLNKILEYGVDGLSDHSFSAFTGGFATAMGSRIIEKHVKLWETHRDNPDYAHSLPCDGEGAAQMPWAHFSWYVAMIREAERAL